MRDAANLQEHGDRMSTHRSQGIDPGVAKACIPLQSRRSAGIPLPASEDNLVHWKVVKKAHRREGDEDGLWRRKRAGPFLWAEVGTNRRRAAGSSILSTFARLCSSRPRSSCCISHLHFWAFLVKKHF
jgi:hypothetical protein